MFRAPVLLVLVALLFSVGPVACSTAREESPLAGANVVLLVIDTLRADRLGAYGYTRPTSPFLDELASRAVLFEQVVAPAAQTVPSMLSMWSAVYPRDHGNQYFPPTRSFRVPEYHARPQVPDDLPLLAEQLRSRGYRTGAVVANPWLEAGFGFARGFDRYEHIVKVVSFYAHGRILNTRAAEILDQWSAGEGPFFLYVHYMDTHYPYLALPGYREEFGVAAVPTKSPEALRAVYDAAVRTTDEYVRELVSGLAHRGLLDSTLIVVTADHGEELEDRGRRGHGHALFEEQVRVPLLLAHPSFAARRIAQPVSLVDLAPTLLDLTGPALGADIAGISLVPWIAGESEGALPERLLYSELATQKLVRRGPHKFIRWLEPRSRAAAFDLAADPEEKRPVAREKWSAELAGALAAFRRAEPARPVPTDVETVDPETAERLEAIGYGAP